MVNTIVLTDYCEIVKKYKCATYSLGMTFDQDVFHDTYIKCEQTLRNKNITKDDIMKYLWVSYINNLRKSKQYTKYKPKMYDMNESSYNIIDENNCHYEERFAIYNIIKNEVINEYGEDEFVVWYLHFGEGKTYEDLEKMGYTNFNFHNLFRSINRYVKNKLLKKHEDLLNSNTDLY